MEESNCGGEGGWTRVAYVNMTESGASRPEGLVQKYFSGLILCDKHLVSTMGKCVDDHKGTNLVHLKHLSDYLLCLL